MDDPVKVKVLKKHSNAYPPRQEKAVGDEYEVPLVYAGMLAAQDLVALPRAAAAAETPPK